VKEAVLDAYRAFAPNPDDQQLAALISKGERDQLEFKVAARWNPHQKAKDATMKDNIIEGVAAFMNSQEGGALLIGVAQDGTVAGLADDYLAVDAQHPGRDSYELFLRNILSDTLGTDCTLFYTITFHTLDGKDVCRISVKPSPKPIYVQGHMYVRDGNRKRRLTAQEAIEYQKQRWG
jgi:predicted HTH transcriptional regulator